MVIQSPRTFVAEPYAPGLTINYRRPPAQDFTQHAGWDSELAGFDDAPEPAACAEKAGRMLVRRGLADRDAEFSTSLRAFTGHGSLDEQLASCLCKVGVTEVPRSRGHALGLLLRVLGMQQPVHHPGRLHCHACGHATALEAQATHFGVVLDGRCSVEGRGRAVEVPGRAYFCLAGEGVLRGDGRCVVITHFGHQGLTQFGAPVEPWGRLKYLDGCTDTLIVPPSRRGDPCLNALYFPPATHQTQHLHPSLRCGVVLSGTGVCRTPQREHPLEAGHVWYLAAETPHSFHTLQATSEERSALTMVAFHPDSDFGPTDTDHPMVNRSYSQFLHRLLSAQRAAA